MQTETLVCGPDETGASEGTEMATRWADIGQESLEATRISGRCKYKHAMADMVYQRMLAQVSGH